MRLQQQFNESTEALTLARDETAAAETAAGVLKVLLPLSSNRARKFPSENDSTYSAAHSALTAHN